MPGTGGITVTERACRRSTRALLVDDGGTGVPCPRGVRQREFGAAPASACTDGGPDLRDILRATLLGSGRVPDGSQRHRYSRRHKVGADGVKRALQDLETTASNLWTAAQDQFGPQGAELERAVDD